MGETQSSDGGERILRWKKNYLRENEQQNRGKSEEMK